MLRSEKELTQEQRRTLKAKLIAIGYICRDMKHRTIGVRRLYWIPDGRCVVGVRNAARAAGILR